MVKLKLNFIQKMAPNTIKNFIFLIREGYYNGLNFHRVEKDWLIQGGNKELVEGEKEYSIKGEFAANGYLENELKFEKGTIGIARKDYSNYQWMDSSLTKKGYDSGYGQFFIMLKNEPEFDSFYTPFGKVIEGIEIIEKISNLEIEIQIDEETKEETKTSKPIIEPIITKMTVNTFGIIYDKPETEEAYDINSKLMNYYSSMQQ